MIGIPLRLVVANSTKQMNAIAKEAGRLLKIPGGTNRDRINGGGRYGSIGLQCSIDIGITHAPKSQASVEHLILAHVPDQFAPSSPVSKVLMRIIPTGIVLHKRLANIGQAMAQQ